ncbi:MAG: hypothetical protein JHC30_05980, partial [Caldisericum sp.]|nr:hypothetical protein [Caldisericum sp.]
MAKKEELQLEFTDDILKKWIEVMMKTYFGPAYREFISKFSWESRVWILWYMWQNYDYRTWEGFVRQNLKHVREYRNLTGDELRKLKDELYRYVLRIVDMIPSSRAKNLAKKVDDYF